MRNFAKAAVPVVLAIIVLAYVVSGRLIPRLQTQEEAALALFLGAVAGVYVIAAAMLVRIILARARGKESADAHGQLWFRRIVFGLAILGVGCFAYGHFVEPYWPAMTRVRIETHKFPQGARPVRIVHISDIHSDPKPRLEERLPQLIAEQKPDLIVFTGDCVNSRGGVPVFKKCLSNLALLAPTFVVQGNWDSPSFSSRDLFAGTGARELDGGAVKVEVSGTDLWVAGVAFGDEVKIPQALDQVPKGAFTVFLHHSPDWIEEIARPRVDLCCAGHTHGGQVALPFYGALITLSKYGKRFENGLYRVGETWLYVNRGIGMEGHGAPRLRFCARPEITVIEIVPAC